MSKVIVIIGVGSNIEPEKNITLAEYTLANKFNFIAKSNFIKTAPIGYTDQDDFINGAFKIETDLNREALRKELKNIEDKLGRVRTENKNGPRTIDLDIAVYDGIIIDDDYYKRDFLKKSIDQLLDR